MKDITKLKINTLTSLLRQFVVLICGFILPYLIIQTYGSKINGLVNSINQFIGIISFLQCGIGLVIQSCLYKCIAKKDNKLIGQVVHASDKFFWTLGSIFFIYLSLFLFVYPIYFASEFDLNFIILLTIAIAINSIFDYFFGIVDGIILTADQKAYVQYILIILTQVLNTIICSVLILNGFSIEYVKLSAALILLLRPIIQRIYILRNYSFNRKEKYISNPISQKWNGLYQHISNFVLTQTDIILITFFLDFFYVSVYSVYTMIFNGLKQLILSFTYSIQNLMGKYYAENDQCNLEKYFCIDEWIVHTIVIFIFGSCYVLIDEFVIIFTDGVKDTNYTLSYFSMCISIAFIFDCLSTPYKDLIFSIGKFKETQNYFLISAIINIVVSLALIKIMGINGVVIGTIAAMIFLLLKLQYYCSSYILKNIYKHSLKILLSDFIIIISSCYFCSFIEKSDISYISWIIKAIKVSLVWLFTTVIVNFAINRIDMKNTIQTFFKRTSKKYI